MSDEDVLLARVKDAIMSARRAIQGLAHVSGGAVRIKKSKDVWTLRQDALDRLDAAIELLRNV